MRKNGMKKTLMWASMLALSISAVACQAENKAEEVSGTVLEQKADDATNSHDHAHDGEHDHAHDGEHDHAHDGEHDHAHDGKHDHAHDGEHNHVHDDEAKQIYAGYFEDEQIKDRELTDWAGDWQSVYPYLLDGTLDEVLQHKASNSDSMSADQYKQYYEIGYHTTVDRIVIEGNQVAFYDRDQVNSGQYVYDGYEVLTYEKGNRGVRYIFKLTEPASDVPTYIQFSDHSISPTVAGHYHLYWGDDRAALLEELENWPTYYPSTMDGQEIVHEMIDH